jgi:hypothetical protein
MRLIVNIRKFEAAIIMMPYKFFFPVFIMLCCCRTLPQNKAERSMPAATKPGTCNIEGKIVAVMAPSDKDTGSICSKYPCRAMVKIIKVFGCGAGVSLPVHGDDTLEMKFAYTLHPTEIFPDMKVHFPGLKKGDVFMATASEHLVLGSSGEFVIYDYEVK